MTRRTMATTIAGTISCLALGGGAVNAQPITLTTLVNFNGPNGKDARTGLTLGPDGNFYGTTYFGGAFNTGTLYRYNPTTNVFTKLDDFVASHNVNPYGSPTFDASGNLFGTTNLIGTIYRKDLVTNAMTTVADFGSIGGGGTHSGITIGPDGNFYGTTYQGGSLGYGSLYRYNPTTQVLTSLVDLDNTGTGAWPETQLVVGPDGNLYGTTSGGGGSNIAGTLFRYNLVSGTFTTLVKFDDTNGISPRGALSFDAAGNLYGTTSTGGSLRGYGTLYRYSTASNTLTTLYDFFPNGQAFSPDANMSMAADGNLYGTLMYGGSSAFGSIVSFHPSDNTLHTLYEFDYTDGAMPESGVFYASDGSLYGATLGGGTSDNGTLFHLTGDFSVVPANPTAPEPGSLLLAVPVLLGGLAAARRRRRVRPV